MDTTQCHTQCHITHGFTFTQRHTHVVTVSGRSLCALLSSSSTLSTPTNCPPPPLPCRPLKTFVSTTSAAHLCTWGPSIQELAEKSAHWAERLTTDFEAKDAELKALTATRDRDLERLQELQARFDRDVADRAAREV